MVFLVQRLLFFSFHVNLSLSFSLSPSLCVHVCFQCAYVFLLLALTPFTQKKHVCSAGNIYNAQLFHPSTVNTCNTCAKNSFRRRCITVRTLSQRMRLLRRMGVFIPDTVSARFVAGRNKRSRPL